MSQNVRFQIQFRKSSPATKIVASVAIVLSILALIALGMARSDIEAKIQAMRNEASHLAAENQRYENKQVGDQDSIVSVQEIAEEELGLVDPDTVIIEVD